MTQLMMRHPGELATVLPAVTAPFVLREATINDMPALAEALQDAFGQSWTSERVEQALLGAADVVRTWLVTWDADVVGTASERLHEQYGGVGYVHWVGVRTSARGHHLGLTLTQACLVGFSQRDLHEAVLETDDFRVSAIRTYLRAGFIPNYRTTVEQVAWSQVFQQLAPLSLSSSGKVTSV